MLDYLEYIRRQEHIVTFTEEQAVDDNNMFLFVKGTLQSYASNFKFDNGIITSHYKDTATIRWQIENIQRYESGYIKELQIVAI